jgi:AAA15 family ATPase/GTPase
MIVDGLKANGIVAVAVTDHHKIDVDRIVRLQKLAAPDLTIFPGIELRSELGGKEPVHLIGIFSERQDATFVWSKLQGSLGLTPQEVSSKGNDRVYVKFEQAAELIHDLGGIVSVHAGRKSNSLENIGNKYPYKQEFKTDLVKSHIDLFDIGNLEDANDYHGIVFPSIGFERPIVICSDNHDVTNYKLKSPCWIKADPVFEAFQQIKSDPRERVYLGEIPSSMDRVNKNPTKYFKSISFRKLPSSALSEDWFSGSVPLNPGLIAIIGNKGMGKTALAESIGLLGNTAQHGAFSFLNTSKFKLPKGNKASHFEASLSWLDGKSFTKNLSDDISGDAVETVSYIPQHYIEKICNELQVANSSFEKELKAVIFSHVADAERLGAESLDSLIEYLTEQTYSRMEQIRAELREINKQIVELQRLGSIDTKQTLENLFTEKTRELEAHDKAKPPEVKEPVKDPQTQVEMQALSAEIETQSILISTLTSQINQTEQENRAAQLRRAVADRVLGRLRNFKLLYDKFLTESEADCSQLGLNAADLVGVTIDTTTPTRIRDDAQIVTQNADAKKLRLTGEVEAANKMSETLTSKLDAPNAQYQAYLKGLQEWKERRNSILGDNEKAGSINYLQAQIASLANVPLQLKARLKEREGKVRETYGELQQLVETYRSLYNPVKLFIERHALLSGKFGFEFEAFIANSNLGERLFQHISQNRRGSFNGTEEGRKQLNRLLDTADFDTEDGAVSFLNTLLDSLMRDKRESPSPPVSLADQLKRGSSELDVLNAVFCQEWH